MSDPVGDPVLATRHGGLGVLTLNRPETINALSHDMVRILRAVLERWADDPTVKTVAIAGAGERGLCAGGDIVAIYDDTRTGGRGSIDFWRDEYLLNAAIATYPKPYVALMDGIVLGGGVGVSAHASHRVVTERTRLGMPEVSIGFVPDVGGTYLLSRAPGQLGTYLALTAGHIAAADTIELGLADHLVPSPRLGGLLELLAERPVDEALAAVSVVAPPAPLAVQRAWIDPVFSSDDVSKIVADLESCDHPGAAEALTAISRHSPTSLAITLRALRAARSMSLGEALSQELRIAARLLRGHDFSEGIRARVIDKDRRPRWSPARLDEVTSDLVASHFEPLGEDDLVTPHVPSRTEGTE
ncbi:MAG: enoyl-CoA hydratase/isomerase family protein [Nocardioidaceae bacterium]